MTTQNLPNSQLYPANDLRAAAMADLGYSGTTYTDLNPSERKRVVDKTAEIILESPSQFTAAQVEQANRIVSRDDFGKDYEDGDRFDLVDAFFSGAKDGFSSTVGTVSDVAGNAVGTAFKASPLFSLAVVGLLGLGVYMFFKK